MTIPEDINELKALIRILIEKIKFYEDHLLKLEAENKQLKAENVELKARLNLDSHNSSKPPSSDGLKKKPAFPRDNKGKHGGQQKHNGRTLRMVEQPNRIVICKTEKCSCGYDLTQEPTQLLSRRQEFDLPEPRLEVTEFQVVQTICPQCGKIHKGEFPEDINAPVQYGNKVKAFLALLTCDSMLSVEKAKTLFYDLYGYPINESTILSSNQTCYEKLEPIEKIIKERIIASPTVNADESGIRCEGWLNWLHNASTSLYTYLFVHKKRGKEAIESEKSILQHFFGWLVHDCWSSYFNLKHLLHAICGAHLLRELQALIENQTQWADLFKKFLLQLFYTPLDERINRRTEIENQYDLILAQAQKDEPQPQKTGKKGKLKRTKGRNLLERLQKYKSAVLAFAFNPEVPFTNNQAERDIRPVKIKQKVSGCFRTFTGAEHYARIAGYVSTVRKNQLNVFKELCNVFQGNSFLTPNTS